MTGLGMNARCSPTVQGPDEFIVYNVRHGSG